MKYYGKISYTIDNKHPDIEYVKNWNKDKIFTYEDKYIFDDDIYCEEPSENIIAYIKHDLNLVAGGGYSTEHIHDVKFDIKRIS